ncbi:Receptor protein [Monoraphidium neglectum]|uniref:Receptor protein n=1 Tax=Monoraphidium neglectum TaxID=145388 RepID=A0A0D2MXC5_9CHLO|nr:Receptor protein [Monoraphidium neglectum]KIY98895.1 Receptor protein [Monoraphidium neglectum]|eukprot:XP_013897915.1 Receptor protein [Monoraphidium neglectum]
MTNNSITGALPDQWANLTSLQALAVGANQLSGKIPLTWRFIPLHSLQVAGNGGVCGEVPAGVGGAVAGGDTGLHSSCPWDADAEALLSFKANLSDPEGALAAWQPDTNPCSATAPWGGIACDADDRVVALRLDGRALGGTLGGGLEGVERLAEIRLAGNNLTGTLPTEWSRQPRLAVVDVSHNRLAGTLPDAWGGGALPALDTVDASGNGGIGGTLPESWGALPLLRVLSLQGNALEGSLPTSWAAAPSLRVLQLDNNRLNGSLADAALPRGVRQVTLSGNALEGGVSPALAERFPDLSVLDLEGNQQMCGQLPALPSSTTVRTRMTGLGRTCSSQAAARQTVAIAVGATAGAVCLAFIAAVAAAAATRRHMLAQHAAPAPAQPPDSAAAAAAADVAAAADAAAMAENDSQLHPRALCALSASVCDGEGGASFASLRERRAASEARAGGGRPHSPEIGPASHPPSPAPFQPACGSTPAQPPPPRSPSASGLLAAAAGPPQPGAAQLSAAAAKHLAMRMHTLRAEAGSPVLDGAGGGGGVGGPASPKALMASLMAATVAPASPRATAALTPRAAAAWVASAEAAAGGPVQQGQGQ